MPEESKSEKIGLSFIVKEIDEEREKKESVNFAKERPFRIVILGDFSGRKNKGVSFRRSGARPPEIISFDRYDFLRLFKLLRPELKLPSLIDASEVSLSFDEMEDFHPDKLVKRIPVLNRLVKISEQLEEGFGFETAFKELQSAVAVFDMPVALQNDFASAKKKNEEKALVSSLLKDEDSDSGETSEVDVFKALVNQTLRPYLTNEITPRQEEIISVFKEFVRCCLRAFIHHADFRSLEASWRSLRFLATKLETAPNLKLHLIDISKEEVSDDFEESKQIEESFVYKLLVESELTNPEAEPWTLLAGDYFFSSRPKDVRLLKYMGAIAKLAKAPFIAGAESSIVASEVASHESNSNVSEEWRNLRLSSEAAYIGLIAPRFLLRLPYGKDTNYCDAADFEELSSVNSHEEYLWGNPVFLGAYLLGDAFLEFGWELSGELDRNIKGLPLHVYRREGETKIKPCAEFILSMKEIQAIRRLGLIPLYSIPGADAARLGDLLSLAFPVSRLRGSWT